MTAVRARSALGALICAWLRRRAAALPLAPSTTTPPLLAADEGPFALVAALACGIDASSASIFGEATVDGAGPVLFRVDVTDRGKADTYRLRLSAGYDSGERALGGGNVRIETP